MKKYLITIIILAITANENVLPQNVDSLYNSIQTLDVKAKMDAYTQLIRLSYSNPDTAFRLKIINEFIEQAKQQKNLEKESYARMQKLDFYYYYNIPLFNENYESFMSFTKENRFWEYYFYIFSLKISILQQNRKSEQAIAETENMHNFAQKTNNNMGLGMTTYVFGKIYGDMNRYQQAEKYFSQSINFFQKVPSTVDQIMAYKALLFVLKKEKKYSEMESILPKWEKLRAERDKQLGFAELAGHFYIDIEYAVLYTNLKQYGKAQQYFDNIANYLNELSPVHERQYKNSLMELYKAEGKYDKAVAIADSLLAHYQQSGNANDALNAIYYKSLLLGKMGRGKEAAELFEQYVQAKDSIDEKLINAKLDELCTQYDVDKLTLEKQRQQQLIIAAGIVLLLFVILIIMLIINANKIQLKNRSIVAQILERDRKISELEKINGQDNSVVAEKNVEQDTLTKENSYLKLFRRIEQHLKNTQNYTDENLNRKKLARELNTNEEYIREAVKECAGTTFNDYLNVWRLQYARNLLAQKENNDTLENIAFACGFQSRQTLHRLFVQQYGLSPGEFRKIAVI
jgi:AraC-like DNA-binding protein